MALTHYPLRYTTGKASNLVALILTQDRTQMRTSGTTMTMLSSIADSSWAAGRLTATEQLSSNGTGTGNYTFGSFPALASGWYVIEFYDVVTPSSSSPAPTDLPLVGGGSSLIYWDGTTLVDGYLTALLSDGALAQINGVQSPAAGSDQCTLTITNTTTMTPVADADVWITSDSAGSDVRAGTYQTDSNGQVVALLDDGDSYYLWAQKDGVNQISAHHFTAVKD